MLHVVEEDPRQRDLPLVLVRRDLAAAERGPVRLVRPAGKEKRPPVSSWKSRVRKPLGLGACEADRVDERCESSARYGYLAGFLARYFRRSSTTRSAPRERAGLMTFLELARDVGELDEVPELRFATTRAAV